MRLACSQVVTGTDGATARPATLTIEGDRLTAVEPGIADDAELLEGWLVPGYVDTHCHGGAGADFTSEDADAVAAAIAFHRSQGSTTLFASTVTAAPEVVVEQVARLRGWIELGELDGIHLEGPCLSPSHKGAHDPTLLEVPTPELLDQILADDCVRMITLAPELHPEAVAETVRHGVVPAVGHMDADAAQTRAAIDAGATVATHLFNAMNGIHHRKPGPVPVLLHDERVMVELICDGTHVAPEVLRMAIDAAGPERVGLVTDAMSATGCADGRYRLGGLDVQVTDGVARIVTDDGTPGAIAGSTLTMARAVEYVVSTVGCTVGQAALMAATTPARWHGLTNVGQLAPGRFADACLVDDNGRLQRVLRRGAWVEG